MNYLNNYKSFDVSPVVLIFSRMSPYKIEFWTDKGYSEDQARYEISIRRIYNKNYWIHKFGESIGPIKYMEFITKGTSGKKWSTEKKSNNKRCREYWKKLGCSSEQIDQEISKIQSTFTLESCIKKYGDVLGHRKFESRQKKWQKSIKSKSQSEINQINGKKDSQSIAHFKKMFGDDWINQFLEKKIGRGETGNLIRQCVQQFSNREELVKGFHKICPTFMLARKVLASKFIRYYFCIDKTELNSTFLDIIREYGITNWKPTKYGNGAMYNGVYYKSSAECEIASFLTNYGIEFSYNKLYPNQKRYYYDFYLVDRDYYIEYCGMNGKSFYDKRIKAKREMCLKNKITCLLSDDVEIIKRKISELYA